LQSLKKQKLTCQIQFAEGQRTTLLMGNFFVNDEVCFQREFMDKAVPIIESGGAEVIADCTPERLHGNWSAGRFFLVQFPEEATCHQIFNKGRSWLDRR
jgi:uncharacterized protein (DUF1330 family)